MMTRRGPKDLIAIGHETHNMYHRIRTIYVLEVKRIKRIEDTIRVSELQELTVYSFMGKLLF